MPLEIWKGGIKINEIIPQTGGSHLGTIVGTVASVRYIDGTPVLNMGGDDIIKSPNDSIDFDNGTTVVIK